MSTYLKVMVKCQILCRRPVSRRSFQRIVSVPHNFCLSDHGDAFCLKRFRTDEVVFTMRKYGGSP